jgi:hypothetical protein
MSHVADDLERLVPRDLTEPPLRINSVRASTWGSSLLKRALKKLGVPARDATVVIAMGSRGPAVLTIMLYAIPGAAADQLADEFRSAIARWPGSAWESRTIAGRRVTWASGDEFTVAFWARDGLVIHVAGRPEDIERAAPRLP